jgi:cytochrome c
MKNARLVWDEATLDAYLADPQAVVPGTTMPFPGEPDADRRAEILAALKALK